MLCERYKNHDLDLVGNHGDFAFFHANAPVGIGSFNILRYGAGVRIDPGDFGDFYMLEMPLSGGVDLDMGKVRYRSRPNSALIISPGRRLISFWHPGTVQLMLKIDRAQMLRRWNLLTGSATGSPPVFETELRMDTPAGWRIGRLLQLLTEEFAEGATRPEWDIGKSPLPLSIIDAMLLTLTHDQQHRLPGATPNIMPRHVKLCTEFMRRHMGEDISVSTLARLSGVSVRSVHDGFRSFLHTSPKQYLLELRLAAARKMLLDGEQSVASVLVACGFKHAGRFSRSYFERFAEYPSQTLERAA